MLVLEGFIILVAYPFMYRHLSLSTIILTLLTLALPALIAGFLFLASWWKSKKSEIPQNSA